MGTPFPAFTDTYQPETVAMSDLMFEKIKQQKDPRPARKPMRSPHIKRRRKLERQNKRKGRFHE